MSNFVENLNYAFHSESIAYKNMTLRMAANEIERLQAQVAALREALQSIAANTCCNPCQEAVLVARAALKTGARDE